MKQRLGRLFRSFSDPRFITFAALLIALNIILTRFLSIQTPILRIGFGFLPVAVFSMLFGPVPGAIAAALGDVIGFFVAPSGTFFPGFTLSAFIAGYVYGLFLHRKNITWIRVTLTCLTVILIADVLLNTVWLFILTHQPIAAIILPRLVKSAIMLPIQSLILFLFHQLLGKRIPLSVKTPSVPGEQV